MFEGVVASLLNRYLGKYIEDLDPETLNVGIFSGNVTLTNLKVKTEALYEIGLPIVVKKGIIGKLSLNIPWSRLCSQTSVVSVEDIIILAGPVTSGPYEPDVEKRLLRAEKKRILDKLDPSSSFLSNESPENFAETLIASILNNLKIFIRKVHIRYEDSFTNNAIPVAIGLCLHNFSIENTNSNWKPISHSSKMGSVYQVAKIKSLSIYCNANCSEILLGTEKETESGDDWIHSLQHSLETFKFNKKESLDFIIKPMSARLKIIINKSNEYRIPKLLIDFVLEDVAIQLSHKQYLALLQIVKSFHRISINRLYKKFHPGVTVSQSPKKWWKYAYDSVVSDRIKPFTWSCLITHRKNYRAYCELYKKILLNLSSAENKMDLQKIEDTLDIYNIILAREETKMKIHAEVPEKIILRECSRKKWSLIENESSQIKRCKLFVNDGKNGFLNQLSQTEKNCLYEMIGFLETDVSLMDKPKQYIRNKFNFTVANFNFSLTSGGNETLVVTMSDILTSVETRPSANSYKISASVESVVIEGASVEYSLIPIITSDNILKGNQNNCFFMFDFEKHPMSSDVDYMLSVSCESLEIIYHEFSFSLLASFLHTPTLSVESTPFSFVKKLRDIVQHLITDSMSRHHTFQLNIDLKLPHLVIPDHGSIQNHENVIVVDLGHLKILSDLQFTNSNLEDATKSELEEKLYDRFHFTFSDFQILMFINGQDWKNYKNLNNSPCHIISKIHSQMVFSNSIKPDYKQLPRYKLNISLQKLKINVSDSRIITLVNFVDNLPRPRSHTVLHNTDDLLMFDHIKLDNNLNSLEALQFSIAQTDSRRLSTTMNLPIEETFKTFLNVDRSTASEISDEDSEQWAKGLDLPGFDDNVSQNNVIIYLFRINIAQIILELKRNSNIVDKSYLVLSATNFCSDIAFMEYGPAMQISLGSINAVDKLHSSLSSPPLQLFNSEKEREFVAILYRKVRSDCPDFKSHFHSVEQSLVIVINPLHIVYHRDAIIDLSRYLRYFLEKLRGHHFTRMNTLVMRYSRQIYRSWFKSSDPPIPPGATKFSYSACISCINLKLCDTELDFLLIKISGFEIDFLFKANERFILRIYIAGLSVDDISNTSLYPKVVNVEDEKFIEMKYDRRTPRAGKTNIELNQNDIKCDGRFKFHLGRINIVLMFKLIADTEKFFSPFTSKNIISWIFHLIGQKMNLFFEYLRFFNDKIFVSIDCQLPTLLMPQHASSPNLLIFNTGDLTAENFFKEVKREEHHSSKTTLVMENTLIKMDAIFVSRGVVNLNGTIIVQETIMEPTCCKIDKKRLLISEQISEDETLSTFDVNMTLNKVNINLGQKDLTTLHYIWRDNVKKMIQLFETKNSKKSKSVCKEEADVRRLQAFFYQSEKSNRKDLILLANFDGVDLCLYNDIDEILSSPVRDESRSLSKFKLGETILQGQYYANGRSDVQISLQSILLEDTRSIRDICIRRILQSYGATTKQSNNENVCVTVPPVISVTIGKNPAGESHCDILVDYTRFNFSVSFLSELFKFIFESIPEEVSSISTEGRINYGYVGENICIKINEESNDAAEMRDVEQESLENGGGMSLCINCRKPEIMFFSELDDFTKSYALLLRSDLSFEYVRHPANKSFTCVISDLHMLSKFQSKDINTQSDVILQPCVVEISQNWAAFGGEKKLSFTCDKIDVHVSASTIQTILNIVREFNANFVSETQADEDASPPSYFSEQDLWSPKKISPYLLPETRHQPREDTKSFELVQSMIISLPIVSLMFEIEDVIQKKPVMLLKMCAEMKLKNWSNSLEMKGDVNVQCSYYNFEVNAWEPVIEPTIKSENVYRPWEISIKAFKSKAYPIHTVLKSGNKATDSKKNSTTGSTKGSKKNNLDSEISADEEDYEKTRNRLKENNNPIDQLDYLDTDSESENEDIVIEKLKSKFSQLLTGESSDDNSHSDSEDSLCEQTLSDNSEDASDLDCNSCMTANSFLPEKKTLFVSKKRESLDSRLESENFDTSATYIVLQAQESFEVVVTPSTLSVIKQIFDSFSLKFNNILADTQFLSLKNDVAPQSTVTLQMKTTFGPSKVLMSANYSLDDSSPSSRNSTAGTPCNLESLSDFEFNPGIESFEGEFANDAHSKMDNSKRKSDGDVVRNAFQFPETSVDSVFHSIVDRQLHLNINGFDELIVICPLRTANKFHILQPLKNGIKYYVVVSVVSDLWGQSITVRSPLQLKNETCYALALYYKKTALDNTDFELIGEVTNPFDDSYKFAILEPDEIYNVPLMITYHCSIYLLPLSEDYHLSETGLWWRELANNIMSPKDIICKPKNEKSPLFVVRAFTTEGVYFSSFAPTVPNFQISLLPSVVIYNLLPCAFYLKIPSADFNVRIEAGGKSSLYSVDMSVKHAVSIEVPLYFGVTWDGTFNLCHKLEEKLLPMKTEQDTDGGNKQLSLNVRADKSESCHVIIYAPYWIINKTGLPVQIKTEDILLSGELQISNLNILLEMAVLTFQMSSQPDAIYDTFVEEPLFFSFRKSQKRTIRMRVYQSSWSSPAFIDIAGCSVLILCRDRERNRSYHILMEVSMSQLSPSSTRLVTLMPYFLLSNECRLPIRYMEENEMADLWVDLPPNQTIPFWPETQSMKMYVKLKDSSLVSQHFYINEACQTVLRMDKGSALVVDITGGQNEPFLITFRHYNDGDAPVRIDNFCEDLFLKIFQGNLGQVTLLSPYQSLLYTWDDPTEEKKLLWNVYDRKNKGFTIQFEADGYGQEFVNFKLIKQQSKSSNTFLRNNRLSSSLKKLTSKYNADSSSSGEESGKEDSDSQQPLKTREGKVIVYWVSYLENKQRVLLFTQDEELAYYAYSKIDSERSNLEIFLSFKGIGLSLVKKFKDTPRELAYFSLSNSSSTWEVNIAHSWKILPLELATWLEHQWSQGMKKAQMRDYINVDLEKMHLIKPFYGELRRSYHPAVWMHCRKSLNYYYFQWKIHRIQVDNQLSNCGFPTVLYPKVLSYDIVRKYGIQPCLELTVLKKQDEPHSTNVFKYVKFTALEFHLQLDKYFVFSLFELIQPYLRTESPSLRIRADICKVHHPLTFKFNQECMERRKTIFEYIYISPIKIQFSFAMQNVQNLNSFVYDTSYLRACLYHLFNCLNVAFMDSKAIKTSCSCLEEFGLLTYPSAKFKQLSSFYLQNLLQPIYANFLGMDTFCLPNVETHISEDYVDLFYDLSLPFVKKLDEFAEAISEDARCLLSHVCCSSVTSNSSLIMCGKRTSLDLGLSPELLKKIRKLALNSTPEESKKKNLIITWGKIICQLSPLLPLTKDLSIMYFWKNSKSQISFEELEHIFRGDQCFEIGVLHGLSGVYMNSSTGFKAEATELFFRSVGKHLLRLMNKYSSTISNIRATAIDCIKRAAETGTDIIFRRRLPKYINPFGMRPYSVHHAIGLNILNTINKGIYSEVDDYWTHIILDQHGRSCLLLTLQHIFFIKKIDLWDEWKTEWSIMVNNIIEVPKVVDQKLIFKIKQDETMSHFDSKDNFIEHGDENLLFWLQKMIEIIFIVNLENKPRFFVKSQELEK